MTPPPSTRSLLHRLLAAGCGLCALALGCAHEPALPRPQHCSELDCSATAEAIIVSANQRWVDTGVVVEAGEAVTVAAHGRIGVKQTNGWKLSEQLELGPEGTFLYSDDVSQQTFPLPSAASGPAPCYCLLGRIGDGEPFYVGARKSWVAEQSGSLQLGINDFDVSDNLGHFIAEVSQPESVQPVAYEEQVPRDAEPARPAAGCSAVVFYVDGLRPDVVREMVAMGHLPHIDRLFVAGGAWTSNAFTAFPSDTITSNGTMWTGCFSDRHGLKGQVRFSRRTLHSESYLEPLGPSRSARLLAPQGIDKLAHEAQVKAVELAQGAAEAERFRHSAVTGVAPIYQHLRAGGADWATGALPMMTEVPPLLWTRSMVRHMPYFDSQEAWKYVDDANTDYALRSLLGRREPVTIIWLPETDSVSHKQSRGQFGMTRRTIARADRMIGQVVDQIAAEGRLSSTYFVLVSDHGHHGGDGRHLSNFDLANEFFFKPREVTADGQFVGGGLGMSVRQHRFWNRHAEDGSQDFVFIDGDSDGAARIFLPRGHFHSGQWMGTFEPGDLLHYSIAQHLPPANLIESLTTATAVHGDGGREHPVDLVLVKLSASSILISTHERGHAVVERHKSSDGRWMYRYQVVGNLRPTTDGQIAYDVIEEPQVDPLGLYDHVPAHLLSYEHDERIWLRMTTESKYPDSIVALTRHMLWQENLDYREPEYAPDLVVTARSGWYFGAEGSPGTMHGYPLPDAMHATLFFSGPNIRRGARIDEPCRLVDLTPTLLEMVGAEFDVEELDGRPLRTIYQTTADKPAAASHPVYWQDVDLQAWRAIQYTPLKPHAHLPFTINRPSSLFDLNNIAYNVLSVSDVSLLRLFDDVLFPLAPGDAPITTAVETVERRIQASSRAWAAEGVRALNVSGVSLGDYSMTSLGNLKRADGAIDWAQSRGDELEQQVVEYAGAKSVPGMSQTQTAIDTLQQGVWEIYRFAQRVIVELLDENVLNSIENNTDNAINAFRAQPAELVVPAPLTAANESANTDRD